MSRDARAALVAVVSRVLVGGALVGSAVGLGVRGLVAEALPAERAAAVLTIWLVVASVAGGAMGARHVSRRPTLRTMGLLAAGTLVGAALCSLIARAGAAGLGAALVPCACGVLAVLVARTARLFGLDSAEAVLPAAALPLVLIGALFVADPWIEWHGSTPASPVRARRVLLASPLAAVTSVRGGAGVDWLASKMMYDGPERGGEGLSVIGQYYPSPPPSPFAFSACLLGLGGILLLLPGRWAGTLCPWRPPESS